MDQRAKVAMPDDGESDSPDRGSVTVIDRIRALGFEPESRLTWIVGDQVRDRWTIDTGALPEKALRRKTSGGGSHCFAVYPERFVPMIDAIIIRVAADFEAESARQPGLF